MSTRFEGLRNRQQKSDISDLTPKIYQLNIDRSTTLSLESIIGEYSFIGLKLFKTPPATKYSKVRWAIVHISVKVDSKKLHTNFADLHQFRFVA